MKIGLVILGLLLLFSECANRKVATIQNPSIILDVVEAFIQREYAGMEGALPQLKVTLSLVHHNSVEIEKVLLLNEELLLSKSGNTYTAIFKNDGLLTFKGTVASGILTHSIDGMQRELPINFKIKEDLYLP